MTSRKSGSSYAVGRGKPPAASQFKPGQSGNPSGRPKKAPRPFADLRAVLASKLRVGEGPDAHAITMQEALIRKARQMAIEGNGRAQTIVQAIEDRIQRLPEKPDPYKKELDQWEVEEMARRAADVFGVVTDGKK